MTPSILITGGSGFLGKALALKLKSRARVVIGSRNNARNQTAEAYTGCQSVPLDVSNIESVRDVIAELRPSAVVHAAASKFVDVSERRPMECVDVNVLGSQNVLRVCIDRGVPALIGVSTDKAAPPAGNIYGLSKAMMERMFCLMAGKTETKIACVRFGNIAWSTGSVLPIWKRMHTRDGVIGTTGPHMRRFFFTVDEASELVIRALDNVESLNGKVLSQRMKAAQIADLLEACAKAWGGRWERIEGRPGDKLDEYLIGQSEVELTETIQLDGRDHYVLDFSRKATRPLEAPISSETAERFNTDELMTLASAEPVEEAL